jgi:hypothetical protein
MEVGCNVFLTSENASEFDAMIADLLGHGVTQFAVGPASYLPTARSRRYEELRPRLEQLLPLVEPIHALPGPTFHCAEWENLAEHTEAAYVRQALSGAWPEPLESHDGEHSLVCRPNLDLYWGTAGRYRRRYGNLRQDEPQQVLQTALADGEHSEDALWFALDPIPTIQELARRYGDREGDRVHFSAESLRRRWLDRAQRKQQP